ncbi:MAG: 4-hydroxythreonine-4-phosphate dehydrogenase PdxA [Endomicrobiales bacterium]|nr:4-hydroxythreonine-4-phosphate dehydrogenase PdxA [Endomicrobiales bacterium]
MVAPKIAITMGDPAGIGPEILVRALMYPSVKRALRPVIVGNAEVLKKAGLFRAGFDFELADVKVPGGGKIRFGKPSAVTGRLAYECVVRAAGMAMKREVPGIVTAPVSKEVIKSAGLDFIGHTELIAGIAKVRKFGMMMSAGPYNTVMVTRHVPVAKVSAKLTPGKIAETAVLAESFIRKYAGIRRPRVVVCSLNPHAGDGGLIGNEDEKIVAPAVRVLTRKGIDVSGPMPPDAAWVKMKQGKYDLLVAMYHEQVMIPLKFFAPEKVVNITVGLPYVRTSPGHGTAFDIAGKGVADPGSMAEALLAAARFCGK